MNLYTLTSLFEDPIGLERPLWRDYSRYQGQVDFAIAAANTVLGMAARSTISWGYQDPWWNRNWSEAGLYGMYRTSYHVIYPEQPIVRQADNWYNTHPEIERIPRVIDLEVNKENLHPEAIAVSTWDMSELVKSRDGLRPIIYSRKGLLDLWLASWTTEMLNEHYYWLAQYLFLPNEHSGPPDLPNRVNRDRIVLHQTSHKKPGFPGEVESNSVDWDRWEIGNELEMHQWISQTWGGEIPPPIPVEDWRTMLVDQMSIRYKPEYVPETLYGKGIGGKKVKVIGQNENGYVPVEAWLWEDSLRK